MKNDKVYIIAEVGVNHNGSFDLAKEMILLAKNAGVDAVNLQTFIL
jgi:N-acetylneuraminate synthase